MMQLDEELKEESFWDCVEAEQDARPGRARCLHA